MAKLRKLFTDYPEYAEGEATLAKLLTDAQQAREAEAKATKAAADAEPIDPVEAEAHALVHGDGGTAVALQVREALDAARHRREVLERAVEKQREVLAAFRQSHHAEVVAAWEPEIRAAQARQVEARIEATRADAEYWRVRWAMEAAGLSIGGDFGSMEGPSVLGTLADPYSSIRSLINEATQAGVKLPKIPELHGK